MACRLECSRDVRASKKSSTHSQSDCCYKSTKEASPHGLDGERDGHFLYNRRQLDREDLAAKSISAHLKSKEDASYRGAESDSYACR